MLQRYRIEVSFRRLTRGFFGDLLQHVLCNEVGQIRKGIVKNIADFGAFIDLGGLDGLLHITDMSWGRVGHPSEVVHIGDELDVKVLDIDWDRERISLGIKQLEDDPFSVRGPQADIQGGDMFTGICYEENGRRLLAARGQWSALVDRREPGGSRRFCWGRPSSRPWR